MSAAGNSFLNQDPVMAAGARVPDKYFASSSHVTGAHCHSVGGAPITMAVPDMGFLVAGIGMAPSSFVMPEGALAAGYGAMATVPVGVVVPQQQQAQVGGNNGNLGSFKGAWTRQEDEVLKQMVIIHGDRKWATIAKSLPGRIGKQCRERWTNHLRPDIKKDVWTEEDDRMLIEAHKTYGNRWSAIARCLPGRSENAVKNHWNATKRSLKSKRRMKKKKSKQVVPGQLSPLEEYIRNQYPPAVETTPPPPVSAPPADVVMHVAGPVSTGPTVAAGSDPPEMGIYLGLANPAGPPNQLGAMNLNMSLAPDLNAYNEQRDEYYLPFVPQGNLHYGVHVPAPASALVQQQQGISVDQDLHSSCLSLYHPSFPGSHPGSVEFSWQSSTQANVGGCYSEAGPSSASGSGYADDVDVIQMASRQFLMPSEAEVTLDLTRFK
ncbi:hypothetical protein E2562_024274 [Oryza meyeriana var. granulata]|uniref:Uncharacterized protein n=1 Tax=Oryza meyeriana var. granulata TaxID=110450 RepID=A0A6G1E1E9_9ORYZ|nr:hypothetical protein E2562_024274 [Oryza meyeriana var. granulata]